MVIEMADFESIIRTASFEGWLEQLRDNAELRSGSASDADVRG